jgi:phenylpropionate dioxygenase-like ring-hydroxylating dioxygenase large terminal subunit
MEARKLAELIERQRRQTAAGFGLAREFYRSPEIYQRDLEQVFLRSWIYACHASEIPNIGDFQVLEIADESVIICRSSEEGSSADRFSALINVCRHRGSRVCTEAAGNKSRFVCPYHAWAYDLDGGLAHARHMPAEFDRSTHSLKTIQLRELHGLLFVNFDSGADRGDAGFDALAEAMDPCLAPYGLREAKVAHRQTYRIEANWKLAVENYSECYHCAPAHPEYSMAHSLKDPGARATELMNAVMAKADACGLSSTRVNQVFDTALAFGADYAYERYPLLNDFLTGSEDGQAVAPLMGSIHGFDGGTTDLQVGPVTFGLAYCDHVVLYRFTPRGVDSCDCDITWLVNGSAEEGLEEGKDYQRERLTWLWDVTTIADKRIIEDNQAGVNSRYYEPGPLSEMEVFTRRFASWYLNALS